MSAITYSTLLTNGNSERLLRDKDELHTLEKNKFKLCVGLRDVNIKVYTVGRFFDKAPNEKDEIIRE